MKQDLLLSFLIHFIIVIAMVISSPFKPKVNTDLGDVIQVNLRTFTAPAAAPEPEPIEIPQEIVADEPVVTTPEIASVIEAKPIDKPKPEKPKPKPIKNNDYNPDALKEDKEQSGTKDGQKDVSENLSSGSKFGGAAIDNASFDYPYWFVQAFSKIERNWRNPVFSNQPLSCIIYFQVIRSGRIIKTEIEQSSGVDAFDGGCERAVNISQPLPPLPDQFADEIIGIHLEFPYSSGY
ncbi:MAG: TonB C-terminal domain-containing protein [candidate division Zixibacteria bacterium]|nr:TonB C-terminal domain-containing protein [candidate division Zixibacteria bacterium]